VAIGYQYRHHNYYVPDGLSDPKYPKSRHRGHSIKLDELIRATKGAHNALLDLEELDAFRTKYELLAATAREDFSRGVKDTGTPQA